MKIKEKLFMDIEELKKFGAINVVIFGDSVSHGAVNGYIDYENVYWNRLKKKLNAVRELIPVNMINSAIGGTTALESLSRLDSQLLKHEPDLVIICFGLNDVNFELSDYLGALEKTFRTCIDSHLDVIFMTPNMLNTRVAADTPKEYFDYAHRTAEMQNSGRMDEFIYSAVSLANTMGVTVCDCYSEWKKLAETEDTTMLLANRINHPTPEMHELFADKLFKLIMEGGEKRQEGDDGMINLARS